MASNSSAELCMRCRAIDLDSIFKSVPDQLMEDEPLIVLGKLTREWETSPCPFCQFFLSMISRHRDLKSLDTEYGVYKGMSMWRTHRVHGGFPPSRTILDVKPIGSPTHWNREFVNYSKTSEPSSLLDHDRVDYEVIKGWCTRFHTPDRLQLRNVEDLPLLVIDCSTREIVPTTPDCEYFALSYVWGPASTSTSTSQATSTQKQQDDGIRLPDDLPATVEDAIRVVTVLGFRYLWVDKYCLDQNRAAEFREQLQRMAGIYRSSVATIVAAAGLNAEHGLPGVGSRARTKQPRVRIGDYTLWSSMTEPRTLIAEAVWIKRAWTYQEGVCSAHLIVFTDEQVYYQRPNTAITHLDRGRSTACELFPDGGLGGSDGMQPLDSMVDILEANAGGVHRHIEHYVMRALSYQSDALNGILGILKRCGNGPYPLNHYYGIPLLGPLDIHRLVMPRATNRSWPLTEAFLVGIFWTCEGVFRGVAGARRDGFPSWSWTGWHGGYECPAHTLLKYGLYDSSEVHPTLFVRQPSGDFISWEEMCLSREWHPSQDVHTVEKELYLQAPTKMVRIIRAPAQLEGKFCYGNTHGAVHMKWMAVIGDDEADGLVHVRLTDGAVVARLDAGEPVSLKAIILRCLSLDNGDCSQPSGYSERKAHYWMRASALLVSETDEGAVKAGILLVEPESYRVQQRGGSTVVAPSDDVTEEVKDGKQLCRECATILRLFMEGAKEETIKLI